jgi:hypothetical protein
MDNTHYISTELLSLEYYRKLFYIINYWRYQKAKVNIQNVVSI